MGGIFIFSCFICSFIFLFFTPRLNWMTASKGDRPKISSIWNLLRDRLSHLSSDLGQALEVLELEFKPALPKMSWDFPHHSGSEADVLLTLIAALFFRSVISRDRCRHAHTTLGWAEPWELSGHLWWVVLKFISHSSLAPTLSCSAQLTGLSRGGGCPGAVVGCLQHRTNALGAEHISPQDLSNWWLDERSLFISRDKTEMQRFSHLGGILWEICANQPLISTLLSIPMKLSILQW